MKRREWEWMLLFAAVAVLVALWLKKAVDVTVENNRAKIEKIARAIARQEGFHVTGSRPQRNHNPGNLTLDLGFPFSGKDGIYVIFKTDADGWAALYKQVSMMLNGTSRIYKPSMTIAEVAARYTTTQQAEWARNVASFLGVSVNTKLSEVA